jgi:hypothetical protein
MTFKNVLAPNKLIETAAKKRAMLQRRRFFVVAAIHSPMNPFHINRNATCTISLENVKCYKNKGYIPAGGASFETILIFRVAAPSRFFEGAEGLDFPISLLTMERSELQPPFKTERVGRPEGLNQLVIFDVLERYHPAV